MSLATRLRAPAPSDLGSGYGGGPQTRLRLLVLADRMGPTFQINFGRPLASAARRGDIAVSVVTERDIRRSVLASAGPIASLAARLWLKRLRPQALFFSRCAEPGALAIATAAQARGIPCIYHIDDDLLGLSPDLGAATRQKHADPRRVATIRKLLATADLAYISTSGLRDALAAHGALPANVYVGKIAAAAPPAKSIAPIAARPQIFGYMGSRSHAADLAMIAPAIRAALTRYPYASFEIFGSVETPGALDGLVARRHPVIDDYDAFLAYLSGLNWRFGLAPLKINEFNACKTNTKWVEYAAAGIATLTSDHPVYKPAGDAGAALMVGETDWATAIARALEDPVYLQSLQDAGLSLLTREYRTDILSRQIADCLDRAGIAPDALASLGL